MVGYRQLVGYLRRVSSYTTAANERLQSVFETERQTFPIESAGHVGLTPLRKPLLEWFALQHACIADMHRQKQGSNPRLVRVEGTSPKP
ncbi:hypothetical protein PCASD_20979 [Puccinia coronata f. sp. avenae]|uniref:Uncharacterized protein n=1 Tax=Puccinia coronata f. sp. avenae TaxID=200324 RepID=A0A2N5SID5_9BASI|nr:hypothetical protein PCASD_20979 [Puccinia coronata f. sp. avenae]